MSECGNKTNRKLFPGLTVESDFADTSVEGSPETEVIPGGSHEGVGLSRGGCS